MPKPNDSADPVEPLLSRAVQVLEQRGEPGLQEFLTANTTHAEAIRAGLERLRRLGILAPPPAAPAERTQFGEFRVQRRLGTGGMGVVYAAEQTSLGRTVALKVVRPEFLLSTTARERFQREVDAIARLHHPGIVPILAVGSDDSQPWYAMEFVEGHTFERLIVGMQGKDPARADGSVLRSRFGQLPSKTSGASAVFAGSYWEACVRLVLQVAQAMSYVHERGIVHRDLKPSNVIVAENGQAMLLDFGLAHVRDLQRVTLESTPLGSPAYAAPEQLRGDAVDERVDVYGLGVTLYELLTTHLPFEYRSLEALQQAILAGGAKPVRAWNRAVPRDLEIVCAVAIDRDRGRRYRSMADFAADLDRVLGRRAILARPLGWPLRLLRLAQRHPTWAVAVGALLLLALQFPLLLWRQEARTAAALATANDKLTLANRELERQRLAVANSFDDALDALQDVVVQAGHEGLIDVPGSEPMRLQILQRAERMYEQLRSRDQVTTRWRLEFDAARNLQYIGALLMNTGDSDAAVACYQRALDRLAPFAGDDCLHLRGSVARLLGLTELERGRLDAAAVALAAARCDLEQATQGTTQGPAARRQLAESIGNQARLAEGRGQRSAQLKLLRQAQVHKDALVAEAPHGIGGNLAAALGCEHLAKRLVDEATDEATDEAQQWAERGIALLVRFTPTGIAGVEHRTRLAGLFEALGLVHDNRGRHQEALDAHWRAFALRWSLAQDQPSHGEYWYFVAGSLHNLGLLWRQLGDRDQAAELVGESLEPARRAVRQSPQNREFRSALENQLANYGGLLLELRRLEALDVAIDELIREGRGPRGSLSAARFSLRLAALRGARDGSAAEADGLRLRAQALQCVETAVGRGFRDRSHFEKGQFARFYDPIRADPRFVAALARMPGQ